MITSKQLVNLITRYNELRRTFNQLGAVMWQLSGIHFDTVPLLNIANRNNLDIEVIKNNDTEYPYRVLVELHGGYTLYSICTQNEFDEFNLSKYMS